MSARGSTHFVYTVSYCLEAARKFRQAGCDPWTAPTPSTGFRWKATALIPKRPRSWGATPFPCATGSPWGSSPAFSTRPLASAATWKWCRLKAGGAGWILRPRVFPGCPRRPTCPHRPRPGSTPVRCSGRGTNVSEGRGTTQPFEVFGAPFFDTRKILAAVDKAELSGIWLRPLVFEPTASKWSSSACHGFQMHVTDPARYRPYEATLELLRAVLACHPAEFAWRQPPYEYEFEKLPIVLLTGATSLHRQLAAGVPGAHPGGQLGA